MSLKTLQKITGSGKKMRGKTCSQRSRGKYLRPTPEKLKRLIELVNTLPPFHSLELTCLHPAHLQAQTEAELQAEGGRKNAHFEIRLTGLILEALKMQKLSPVLLDYVTLGFADSGKTLHGMIKDGGIVGRYQDIWTANIRLHHLAKLAQAVGRPNFVRSNLCQLLDRSYVLAPLLKRTPPHGIATFLHRSYWIPGSSPSMVFKKLRSFLRPLKNKGF